MKYIVETIELPGIGLNADHPKSLLVALVIIRCRASVKLLNKDEAKERVEAAKEETASNQKILDAENEAEKATKWFAETKTKAKRAEVELKDVKIVAHDSLNGEVCKLLSDSYYVYINEYGTNGTNGNVYECILHAILAVVFPKVSVESSMP
jgi:hypothetical protein